LFDLFKGEAVRYLSGTNYIFEYYLAKIMVQAVAVVIALPPSNPSCLIYNSLHN